MHAEKHERQPKSVIGRKCGKIVWCRIDKEQENGGGEISVNHEAAIANTTDIWFATYSWVGCETIVSWNTRNQFENVGVPWSFSWPRESEKGIWLDVWGRQP